MPSWQQLEVAQQGASAGVDLSLDILCPRQVLRNQRLETVFCTDMHPVSLNLPLPQNILGLPEGKAPGLGSWNQRREESQAGASGTGGGGHLLPAPGHARRGSGPRTQLVLLETAAPAKGTMWRHLSGGGEGCSLQNSTLPMPTWQPRRPDRLYFQEKSLLHAGGRLQEGCGCGTVRVRDSWAGESRQGCLSAERARQTGHVGHRPAALPSPR